MTPLAFPHDGTAHYLANEGVMVVHGEQKILFDPAFHEHYGQYELVPAQVVAALLAGDPPFDGVDALFVSHHHGDHFSPQAVLDLLEHQRGMLLFAPEQAIEAMLELAGSREPSVRARMTAVMLEGLDTPVSLQAVGLDIEAVRIPHSGWPERHLAVENIAWRVTLDGDITAVHLGDADPNDVHFASDADYWAAREPAIAFPPYWFFSSRAGPGILEHRIKARQAVGVHVPVSMPDEISRRPAEYRTHDLFTRPGETRVVGHAEADVER